jgi:hypothetical protein
MFRKNLLCLSSSLKRQYSLPNLVTTYESTRRYSPGDDNDNIKTDLKEMECEETDWVNAGQEKWRAVVHMAMKLHAA